MKQFTDSDKVRMRAGNYRTTLRLFTVIIQLIHVLCEGRKSIRALAENLDVSERTVRRYIKTIESMEIAIELDFHGKYFIANDNCPICGLTTNNHK